MQRAYRQLWQGVGGRCGGPSLEGAGHVDGREETAIAAVWVTDGIDRCCVGFLKRHMVRHAACFDGALAQVTRVLSGSCDSA